MKTIKLTILALLLSGFTNSQDTLQQMISGDNYLIFDNQLTKIVSQTNELDKGDYKNITIKISQDQYLRLGLYDNCKKCLNKNIKFRNIIFKTIENKKNIQKIRSDDNFILVDGSEIKEITVLKPDNEYYNYKTQ